MALYGSVSSWGGKPKLGYYLHQDNAVTWIYSGYVATDAARILQSE